MRLSFIIVLALALVSCATRYINPTTVQNPPPAETFSAFGQFELKPVSLAPAYSADNANQRATARIQDHSTAESPHSSTAGTVPRPRGNPFAYC